MINYTNFLYKNLRRWTADSSAFTSSKTYLDENSRIVANRLTTNKDSDDEENYKMAVPAKILEKRITDLYKAFPLANQMCISTFLKYARKTNIYKKPQRLTDLCDYCDKARSIKLSLAKRDRKSVV